MESISFNQGNLYLEEFRLSLKLKDEQLNINPFFFSFVKFIFYPQIWKNIALIKIMSSLFNAHFMKPEFWTLKQKLLFSIKPRWYSSKNYNFINFCTGMYFRLTLNLDIISLEKYLWFWISACISERSPSLHRYIPSWYIPLPYDLNFSKYWWL